MNGPMQFTAEHALERFDGRHVDGGEMQDGCVVDEYVDATFALADRVDDRLPLLLRW